MPTFEFISPDKVPANSSRFATAVLVAEMVGKLREALRTNQALRLCLKADERPARLSAALRVAAATVGVGLLITQGEPRPFTNQRKREVMEASVLYVRFTKPGAHANGQIEKPEPRAIRIPEPTVSYPVRGMEVQR